MSVFFRHALLRVPLRDFRSRSKLFGVEFITRHVRFFRTCPTAGSASGLPPLGHCFVVGDTRHQLRASMSAALAKKSVLQSSPHGRTGIFFPGKNPDLSAGSAGLLCRAGAAGEASMFAETVGLDDSFDFFSWEESRPWRGLRCRAGGAAGEASMFAKTVGLDDSFDFFFLGRIPTLARARQASDAGQVVRQGGYARRGRHPGLLAIRAICAISHKASH